ncbi:MAG: LuxR C-terminal-related transcriptional regulator [Pseudomonadales bacterium]
MRSSYSEEMFEKSICVVVAGEDGRVIAQNRPARALLGSGTGKFCWDVVGNLPDAEQLPCEKGCVMELLARGMDTAQHTEFKVCGVRHELTCVAVDGAAICLLGQMGRDAKALWRTLSPREQEILLMLANGETNPVMAERLGLSQSTVRTHVERMRSKLCVNTRAAMVAEGFRLGYLS